MSSNIHCADQVWEFAEELAGEIIDHYPPTGLHGILHPLRLLGLAPGYCKSYSLPTTEFLLAAAFHDIGRVNDDEDEEHGTRSAELLEFMHPEASKLALDLVRNHCKVKPQSDYPVELEYFKDLDAIDRQRYGERHIKVARITKDLEYWLKLNSSIMLCDSWDEICDKVE